MRHKVIENLFREQFCLRDVDQVEVKFLSSIGNKEEFVIENYQTIHGVTTYRKTVLNIEIKQSKTVKLDG